MTRRISVGVSLGLAKVVDHYPLPDDWDSLTDEEKDDVLDDYVKAHMQQHVDSWADVEED